MCMKGDMRWGEGVRHREREGGGNLQRRERRSELSDRNPEERLLSRYDGVFMKSQCFQSFKPHTCAVVRRSGPETV